MPLAAAASVSTRGTPPLGLANPSVNIDDPDSSRAVPNDAAASMTGHISNAKANHTMVSHVSSIARSQAGPAYARILSRASYVWMRLETSHIPLRTMRVTARPINEVAERGSTKVLIRLMTVTP
jgi:hypothetical protein